jgi:hypothetical protein
VLWRAKTQSLRIVSLHKTVDCCTAAVQATAVGFQRPADREVRLSRLAVRHNNTTQLPVPFAYNFAFRPVQWMIGLLSRVNALCTEAPKPAGKGRLRLNNKDFRTKVIKPYFVLYRTRVLSFTLRYYKSSWEVRGSVVVRHCYKAEGFETRWGEWIFFNLYHSSGRSKPWGILSL